MSGSGSFSAGERSHGPRQQARSDSRGATFSVRQLGCGPSASGASQSRIRFGEIGSRRRNAKSRLPPLAREIRPARTRENQRGAWSRRSSKPGTYLPPKCEVRFGRGALKAGRGGGFWSRDGGTWPGFKLAAFQRPTRLRPPCRARCRLPMFTWRRELRQDPRRTCQWEHSARALSWRLTVPLPCACGLIE